MCDCIEKVEKLLVPMNTRLSLPIMLAFKGEEPRPQRVLIKTEKLNHRARKGPANMFPTYCPFCGEKYEEGEA